MLSQHSRISRSLLLLMLAPVCSCAAQVNIAPPASDLRAVVEQKPQPTEDIATSQQAYDQYQSSIESWGDRISAAGGRLCRWSVKVYRIRLGCPKD